MISEIINRELVENGEGFSAFAILTRVPPQRKPCRGRYVLQGLDNDSFSGYYLNTAEHLSIGDCVLINGKRTFSDVTGSLINIDHITIVKNEADKDLILDAITTFVYRDKLKYLAQSMGIRFDIDISDECVQNKTQYKSAFSLYKELYLKVTSGEITIYNVMRDIEYLKKG